MAEDLKGKTLREVKALYKDVRVVRVGDESYFCTADFVATRLNVELSLEGLQYTEHRTKLHGCELVHREIKNLDDGIIEEAFFG